MLLKINQLRKGASEKKIKILNPSNTTTYKNRLKNSGQNFDSDAQLSAFMGSDFQNPREFLYMTYKIRANSLLNYPPSLRIRTKTPIILRIIKNYETNPFMNYCKARSIMSCNQLKSKQHLFT